eukprot:gene9526-biopygen8898
MGMNDTTDGIMVDCIGFELFLSPNMCEDSCGPSPASDQPAVYFLLFRIRVEHHHHPEVDVQPGTWHAVWFRWLPRSLPGRDTGALWGGVFRSPRCYEPASQPSLLRASFAGEGLLRVELVVGRSHLDLQRLVAGLLRQRAVEMERKAFVCVSHFIGAGQEMFSIWLHVKPSGETALAPCSGNLQKQSLNAPVVIKVPVLLEANHCHRSSEASRHDPDCTRLHGLQNTLEIPTSGHRQHPEADPSQFPPGNSAVAASSHGLLTVPPPRRRRLVHRRGVGQRVAADEALGAPAALAEGLVPAAGVGVVVVAPYPSRGLYHDVVRGAVPGWLAPLLHGTTFQFWSGLYVPDS